MSAELYSRGPGPVRIIPPVRLDLPALGGHSSEHSRDRASLAATVPNAKDVALREGLGGSFTYCDLGEEMNLERFFAGDGSAPAWGRLAEYVAYTATGETLAAGDAGPDGFVGEVAGFRLHLIYRPDQAWMRSNDAMLDMPTAERIAVSAAGKPVLLFAAGKFMAQKSLTAMDITFCQLPYSIHRILGSGREGVSGVDAA